MLTWSTLQNLKWRQLFSSITKVRHEVDIPSAECKVWFLAKAKRDAFVHPFPTQRWSHNNSKQKMVPNNKYTAPKEHDTNAIRVPTTTNASLNPAHDQEIDLRWMNEQDVKSLQKSGEYDSKVLYRELTIEENTTDKCIIYWL